jgi:hypothetical protein
MNEPLKLAPHEAELVTLPEVIAIRNMWRAKLAFALDDGAYSDFIDECELMLAICELAVRQAMTDAKGRKGKRIGAKRTSG